MLEFIQDLWSFLSVIRWFGSRYATIVIGHLYLYVVLAKFTD